MKQTFEHFQPPFGRKPIRKQVCAAGFLALSLFMAITANLLSAEQVSDTDESAPLQQRSHGLKGVGSCAAAGCHGGGKPSEIVGSEYNIWISRDPHAQAYSTLFSERSQRMVQLLAGAAKEPVTPAHEDIRCLSCHSMTDAAQLNLSTEFASDGVGCEACHGPAEPWLANHYDQPLSSEQREALGMNNTKSLRIRAQICVQCHVGGPGRDVNHDLIAAGHPRLQFSMSAYWEALPKHWIDAEDRAPAGPNYDALIWLFGQAATSEAALRQTAARAGGSGSWPEFAEWSCSACHHDLRGDDALQVGVAARNNLSGRRVASEPWNHFAMREFVSDISNAFGVNSSTASEVNDTLAQAASESRNHGADRASRTRISESAESAADQLANWSVELERTTVNRAVLDRLAQEIIDQALSLNSLDWTSAAQTYDALASIHQSRLQYQPPSESRPADRVFSSALSRWFDELSSSKDRQIDAALLRQRLTELKAANSRESDAP